jgi:hypothetical protein
VGTSEIAINLRRFAVPQPVTDEILARDPHRDEAQKLLARQEGHYAISGLAVKGAELSFACDMTKAIAGLIATSDSLAVGWLNGPVFHNAQDFAGIAREMFLTGVSPLILWIGVHWESGSKSIHTKGMLQFGAPEILLAGQPGLSVDKAEYLFEIANYILTSGKEILEGETVDGPNCTFKVSTIKGADPAKRMLIFVPMKIN